MKKVHRFGIGLVFLAAVAAAPVKAAPGITLFNFQISGIGVFASGAQSLFVHGAWTPSFSFGFIGVRGELGVTWLDLGAGRFLATNYEALLQLTLAPSFTLEGGGGMHLWHGQGNMVPAFSGNLVFTAVPGVDRLYLGYTRYTAGAGANEFKAGFGFNL